MSTELELLGLTQAELREMAIDRAAERIVGKLKDDSDSYRAPVRRIIEKTVKEEVERVAEATIAPILAGQLESFVLQRTNEWGEKQGKPTSFTEYLVARAEAFMAEPVNFRGESKAQARDTYWNANTSRLAYMIHEHLQYQIGTAVKEILADANKSIAGGLQEAVRVQLDDLSKKIKVEVKS